MKLLETLGLHQPNGLVAVKEDPEFVSAFTTLRSAESAHTAARIEASHHPIERVTLASLGARERHALAERAELEARTALEKLHARKAANIIAAYEPQVQAALRQFYAFLVAEARPLAEAVRDAQLARNRLLGGGGVELTPMVQEMLDGEGAFHEAGRLTVESAPFLAES